MNAKKLVDDYIERWEFYMTIIKVTEFVGFDIVSVEEHNPTGRNEFIDFIVKDGIIYNQNLDDMEEFCRTHLGED